MASNFFKGLISTGIGNAVTSGLDYVYDALPSGLQGTLSSVGSFFSSPNFTLGSASIGKGVGDVLTNLSKSGENFSEEFKNMPSGSQVSGSNFSSRGGFQAGQAQMMPLGKTDRVSRAMQDQRVADKLMRMAANSRVPAPNLRGGTNITLSSANKPAVSLSRKYFKRTAKA